MNDAPSTEKQPEPEPQPPDTDGDVAERREQSEEIVTGTGRSVAVVETPPPGREVLMPLDPERVIEGMKAYQAMLPQLLDDSDYQRDGNKKFVKKSGWRKIARAFNLSVSIVPGSLNVERDETGAAIRAECVARAQAPNGQIQDGDGYCSIEERRFQEFRENREGSKAQNMKVENDLRATATTRAKNRAISDLVGMGEVSAEEVDGGGGGRQSGPIYGPVATNEANTDLSSKLVDHLGSNEAGEKIYNGLVEICGGYMPQAVALSILLVLTPEARLTGEAHPRRLR